MTYKQIIQADRRLLILQMLEQDSSYSHNVHIVQSVLASLGHSVSEDLVKTELRWLEEQGLLDIEDISGIMVVKLNQRGVDVAKGNGSVDGIARPRP
jgi:hypothetical protein